MTASSTVVKESRFPFWLILFGLICLLIGLGFIGLHMLNPSDGARFAGGQDFFTEEGVIVSPYAPGQGFLVQGDVVTAVDDRSFETWVREAISFRASRPNWRVGDQITYRIDRDGQKSSRLRKVVDTIER